MIPPKVGAFLDALGNAVHTTQVADLSGKSVAVLGYGPIGAMCAEIARVSGAARIAITEVNGLAAAHARRWAKGRRLDQVTVIEMPRTKDPVGSLRDATGGGADVVLELSGAESSINLGLAAARPGAVMSMLGIPRDKAVTIRDYTNDFVFKGLTIHAIIGRRVFDTWIKMTDLFRAGLDVADLVTNEFEGLEKIPRGDGAARRPARDEGRVLAERPRPLTRPDGRRRRVGINSTPHDHLDWSAQCPRASPRSPTRARS